MFEQGTGHFEVIRAWDIYRKTIDERAEEVLAERGQRLSTTCDFIGRAQGHESPVDIDHLITSQIADDQPVMQAQDLAIDRKDWLASFVHDGRIFTEMEELLADHVAHR